MRKRGKYNHLHKKNYYLTRIVDLLKYDTLSLEQLLVFLKLSNLHRANKKSFVFVNTSIDYDLIPDEIIVVPTIQEAEDIISMEEIERDLGF